MVDHHVDRPEVEAEQSVEPTGTNRSTDALERRIQRQGLADAAIGRRLQTHPRRGQLAPHPSGRDAILSGGLAGLVAIARGKTPDPIPNSAVKTLSANGTAP